MKIPPDYKETPELAKNLERIRTVVEALDKLLLDPNVKKRFRNKMLLRSALASARIEGNPLSLESLTETLLPRREEILNIIKDHQLVNFDFIARRFTAINPRTLRYDLKSLLDKGLIVKRGTTKGVFYSSKN